MYFKQISKERGHGVIPDSFFLESFDPCLMTSWKPCLWQTKKYDPVTTHHVIESMQWSKGNASSSLVIKMLEEEQLFGRKWREGIGVWGFHQEWHCSEACPNSFPEEILPQHIPPSLGNLCQRLSKSKMPQMRDPIPRGWGHACDVCDEVS